MTRLTFITHEGDRYHVDAEIGRSVMEAAVRNGVPGIRADCGGACACATCHVYIDPAWTDRVGERGEMEDAMIEIAPEVRPNSRLSCQIPVTSMLDGLTMHIPSSRG